MAEALARSQADDNTLHDRMEERLKHRRREWSAQSYIVKDGNGNEQMIPMLAARVAGQLGFD